MSKTFMSLYYIVSIGVAIILTFIIAINFIFLIETNLSLYFCITAILMIATICIFSYIKIPERPFLFVFVITALLSKIAAIMAIDAYPVSDFLIIFNAAEKVASGDFSFQNSRYFIFWPYQTGFVLFEALFIKLFGASTLVLSIINGCIMTAINVLVYFVIKRITGEIRNAMFGAVLYLFYPAPYLLASVLTNQHLATFLILLGLYIIIQNNTGYRSPILGGIVIAFGNIIHPIGIVAVMSVVLYFVILQNSLQRYLAIIGYVICFLIAYVVIGMAASKMLVATGVNEQGLKNNDPYWKFALGLNPKTYGSYSDELAHIASQAKTLDERYQIEKRLISESIFEIKRTPFPFFYEKNYRMWAKSENPAWAFGEDASKNRSKTSNIKWQAILDKALKIDRCYYLFLFIFALAGVFIAIVKNKANAHVCLFALTFSLYFGVHLFIEIQTRYRYFAMPLICVLASQFLFVLPQVLLQRHISHRK